MGGHRYRVLAALILFAAAVAGGILFAQRAGPRRLERQIEQHLSAALGTPVTVAELSVTPGELTSVEARGLRAWPGPAGYALEVDGVRGTVDPFALLTGEIRFRRVRLLAPRVRITASASPGRPNADRPPPSELLGPLIALEAQLRALLGGPRFASVIEMEDGSVVFENAARDGARFSLHEVRGRLTHGLFSGPSEVAIEARLLDDGHDRGQIALDGHRERSGAIRMSLSMNSVALGSRAASLGTVAAGATLTGKVSGEIRYETPEPGTGRLDLDLHCLDFASVVPETARRASDVFRAARLGMRATLEITPASASIRDLRISDERTTLHMAGQVERPLRSSSPAALSVDLDAVEVDQVRHLIGWLPEIEREEAEAIVEPLEAGRLASLSAAGRATLSGWQAFLAGRTRTMPDDFRVAAEVVDATVRVGSTDRLEGLRGALEWTDEHVTVSNATAALNGVPLPTLELSIDGFPNFFAGDPALRALHSDAEPLAGLGTLWSNLRFGPSEGEATTVDLAIDALDHPMFLWPMRALEARIESHDDGVRIRLESGRWAGIPIEAEAYWEFLPEERVIVQLAATSPPDAAAADPHSADGSWARGRFAVGPIAGSRWRQRDASGRFVASGGRVSVHDVAVNLSPAGTATADGRLEFGARDTVPFQVSFGVHDGDVTAIAELLRLPASQLKGRVDLAGSFEGSLRRAPKPVDDLSGLLHVEAEDGTIRKLAPPVVAISEASEALDEESDRRGDVVHYDRIETLLEFTGGNMVTQAFSLDGPDIGVVASGELQLEGDNHEIDAEVAVFMFRKLDRVLGKIPILNRLLLGSDANLVAAAFELQGPWLEPKVTPILLPQSAGPASQVLQGVPMFVMRGIRAVGSLIRPSNDAIADLNPTPSGS